MPDPGPAPLVAFEGVTLRAPGGRTVFERLDWQLPRGGRVRVAGGRGSGGTALLRLCAGLAHPAEGRVVLDGVPHDPLARSHPFLRRGALGWVPQGGGLVANLTLAENVALPLRFVGGVPRAEAEARAAEALDGLGLGGDADLRPHALSPGERQLGAMARSALMEAELWLMDRPLDALDEVGLERARRLLAGLPGPPATTFLFVGEGPRYRELAGDVLRLREAPAAEEST